MIYVMNKKRPKEYYNARLILRDVSRPTPLGNPFKIGPDGTREEVIKKYEQWVRPHAVRGKTEPQNAVRQQLDELLELAKMEGSDLILLCWCSPASCHADIIKKILEEEGGLK